MSLQIGHLRLVEPPAATAPPTRPQPVAGGPSSPRGDVADVIGAAPPPEVLDDVFEARERVAELAARNRELHFDTDPSGRIVVQVRDLEGNVIRTIPPSEALDIMAGLAEA